MEGPRFEIGGVEYPVPTQFRISDPALVREVTGMDWETFMQGLREEQEDPVLVSGLVAVAVWQANPAWPRAKVVRWLQEIEWGALQAHGAETNGADAGPPAQGGGSGPASQPSTSEQPATPAWAGTPTPAAGGSQP